jgi:hypothetical protein
MHENLKCTTCGMKQVENGPDRNVYSNHDIFCIALDPLFAGWNLGHPTYYSNQYSKEQLKIKPTKE